MRVRFAPSPTGHLHVGNARTALFNWLMAHGSGGTFVLRIEDTDVERSTRESEEAILEDLRWLGLQWDEGPDIGGPRGPYRQSERLHLYRSYAAELIAAGSAYHCFCSAEQLERERQAALAAGQPPKYSGACRSIPEADARERMARGERAVVRFKVPADREVVFTDLVRGDVAFHTSVIGDPVLLRSDGSPAYNFAVVVDDALMEVTHVVRGEDHISNTPRQILIYEALGFTPPAFAHLALVMGPDHTPLSKRHGATSVAEFRAKGYLPEALVNYLALIGWSPGGDDELLPVDELARRFSIRRRRPQRRRVRRGEAGVGGPPLPPHGRPRASRAARARRSSGRHGLVSDPSPAGLDYLTAVVPMAAASVDRLDEIPSRLRFLFDFDPRKAVPDPRWRTCWRTTARARWSSASRGSCRGRLGWSDRERFRGRRRRREAADRAEGEGALPPDPRGAHGCSRRAGTRPWRCRRSTGERNCPRTPASRRSSDAASARRRLRRRSRTGWP